MTFTGEYPLARTSFHDAQLRAKVTLEAFSPFVPHNADDSATLQLLQHPDIESALRGEILVQLSSGTPEEARQMDSWASQREIACLDGAIMSHPMGIGTPECTIPYSGPAELFERAKPVLLVFGDNAVLVGTEIGQASAGVGGERK